MTEQQQQQQQQQQRPRPRPSPIVDWVKEYDNIGFAPDGAAAWFFEQCPVLAEKFRRQHQHQEEEEETRGVVDSRVRMKLDVKYGATCDRGDDGGGDNNHDPLQVPPSRPRQRYDILTPAAADTESSSSSSSSRKKKKKKGIFVFVHGGYWYKADRSWFTHFADVPLSKGYQVIIPGYTLCPDVRVSDISKEIAQFLRHLHRQEQQQQQCQQKEQEQAEDDDDEDDDDDCKIWKDCPIVLCGHSAGGHLVTRQLCEDLASSIPVELLHRVTDIISLSGVHDLRPIVHVTNHNEIIQLDDDEARRESPVLATPVILQTQTAITTTTTTSRTAAAQSISKNGQVDENDDDRHHRHHLVVTCMVGGDERPEFIRQAELLGNVWKGMGVATQTIHIPNKHHFNIVDEILDPDSTLWTQILI